MKTLIVPAGVLLLSLGAAWLQFTAEPDKIGDNEVLIMANQSTQIEQIDWIATQQEVHVFRKSDDNGDYLWVEYIDKKTPEEPQQKYFLAGKNGDKLLDHLSPLVGIRKLDTDVPLNTLGLDEPSAQLSITSNGKTRVFSIGDEAYGTKDLYVRDDASNELFLVDDSKLRNLQQARTTLPNRALFTQETKQATSAILTWQDASLSLTHQNWQDTKNAQWIYSETSTKDATQIQTWLSKALRISVSRSAAPAEDLSTLTDQFSLTLSWENGEPQTATYAQLSSDSSWWAKTPSTRGYVRVSGRTLEGLTEDIPALFEP
jgi:hypothetical protein